MGKLYYRYPHHYADGEVVCPNDPSHQLLIDAEEGEDTKVEHPSPGKMVVYTIGKFRCFVCNLDFEKEYRSTPKLIGTVVIPIGSTGNGLN